MCRVIALAYKKLDAALSPVEIGHLSREEVESDLEFGAFAVFQCPLKEDSKPALRQLKVSFNSLTSSRLDIVRMCASANTL